MRLRVISRDLILDLIFVAGAAGGPLLMQRIPSAEAEWSYMMQKEQQMDLVVGIVSFTNYSSIDESGIGSVLITGIQDWINDIKMEQVLALYSLYFVFFIINYFAPHQDD